MVSRLLGVVALLAVFAAACGSESEDDTGGRVTLAAVADTAGDIADDHGSPDSFALALVVLDDGYSVAQILEAGGFTDEASIQGALPAAEPTHLILPAGQDAPAAFGRLAAARPRADFPGDDLLDAHYGVWTMGALWDKAVEEADRPLTAAERERREAEQREAELVAVVMGLAARGYGLEQILDGIIDDRVSVWDSAECVLIQGPAPGDPPVTPIRADLLGAECDDLSAPPGATAGPTSDPGGSETASWEGPLLADDALGVLVASQVAIDRLEDGSYSLAVSAESTREAYECSWETKQTAEGTGALNEAGTAIEFTGTFTEKTTSSGPDCATEDDGGEYTLTVDVAEDGTLSGEPFPYTSFSLGGAVTR